MLIEEGRLQDRFYWSGNVLFCDPKYAERIRAVLRRRQGAAAVLDIVSAIPVTGANGS
jgi:hypothetical protein